MTRSFTTREKVLLVVLVVLLVEALHYLLILRPSAEMISTANAEISELQDLFVVEEAKAERIATMQAALDQVIGTPAAATIIPVYDNLQNLLEEINGALGSADQYKLSFPSTTIADGVLHRELQMIFYASDYAAAKSIIRKLYSGIYRCDITSVKIALKETAAEGDLTNAPVAVTMSITYYENYNS